MKSRLQVKILNLLIKPVDFAKGMSISRKFIVMYVIVFAIPIFVYARYSFQTANESINSDFYRQSVDELNKVCDDISNNIEICEIAAQTAKGSGSFLEFVTGDMTGDDVALIKFKREEYAQIVNIQEINPSINAIKFYIDNAGVYELPPVLNKESSFPDIDFAEYLKSLNERLYFDINSIDKLADGSAVDTVSLFWELRGVGQKHLGILEVNMLQSTFFQGLYQNEEDGNSLLYAYDGVNTKKCIFNRNSKFYELRSDDFDRILTQASKNALEGNSTFQIKYNNENLVIICKHINNIDTFLFKVYSLDGITQKLNSVRNNILMFVIGAFVALCLITYLSTSVLTKKLYLVVASIRKVQAGDLSVTVPVKGRDEIDELARHFNSMLSKVKDLISQLLKKQLLAKESEIKALQSQINSHFIYNVLESIRMLAEVEQKQEIGDAIFSLGKLMRYSMRWKDQYVSLEEEIALVSNYIFLINLISDFSVTLNFNVDSGLNSFRIPKMTIQPLVENAVNHGFEPKGFDGVISISIVETEHSVIIEVKDNGMGINEDRLNQINKALYDESADTTGFMGKDGIGLSNVHQRLHLFYGSQYGLIVESVKNQYTRVVLRLPYEKSPGGW